MYKKSISTLVLYISSKIKSVTFFHVNLGGLTTLVFYISTNLKIIIPKIENCKKKFD